MLVKDKVNSAVEPIDFDALKLQAGTHAQVLTHRGLAKAQHISTVIGWDANEYMLIKLPRENGAALSFHEGEKISLRVFSGTAIGTFDTTVIKAMYHPLYCLCLSFPVSMQIKKLRQEMRIKVALDANLVNAKETATTHKVKLDNLSATGALVSTAKLIGEIGDGLELAFTLPANGDDETRSLKMKAKIRNVVSATNVEGQNFMLGMEFVDIDATDQLIVRNCVYKAILETRHNVV